MRVGILGPGAMGCLFAALLSRCPANQVWLLDHDPRRARLLRRRGLKVTGLTKIRIPPSRIRVVAGSGSAPVFDLLLVLVKSYATETAVASFRRCVGPGTLVATLQNGLNNARAIRRGLARRAAGGIVCGTTALGATLLGPGRVKHAGRGETLIGADGAGERGYAHALRRMLGGAGLRARVVGGTAGMIWSKLVINSAMNPLGAALGVPNGALVEDERARRLMGALASESARVARAAGVRLLFPDPVRKVESVCRSTKANRNSMLQDLIAGRPTEIGQISGAVVREARKRGIPAPLNEAFLRALSPAG